MFGRVVGEGHAEPRGASLEHRGSRVLARRPAGVDDHREMRAVPSDKGKSLEVRNATSSLKELRVSVVAVETGGVYEVVS